jgi:hypothetical protein
MNKRLSAKAVLVLVAMLVVRYQSNAGATVLSVPQSSPAPALKALGPEASVELRDPRPTQIMYPANRSYLSVARSSQAAIAMRQVFLGVTGAKSVAVNLESYGEFTSSRLNPGGSRIDTSPERMVLVISGAIGRPIRLGRTIRSVGSIMWIVDAATGNILSIHSTI